MMASPALNQMNKAVFLDRDGTINENRKGYVKSYSEFKFLPNAFEAIHTLSESDYKIIIVTNQAVVGRGIIPLEELEKIHAHMLSEIEAHGGCIDALYACTHHPDAGCSCRKPKTGLVMLAKETYGLDLSGSWFVGDNTKDIKTGEDAGCKTVLVGTGYGGKDGLYAVEPDYVVEDLLAAAKLILK